MKLTKIQASAFISDLHKIGHLLPEQEHIDNYRSSDSYNTAQIILKEVIIRDETLFACTPGFREEALSFDDGQAICIVDIIDNYHNLALETLKDENGDITYPYVEGICEINGDKRTANFEEFESFAKEFFEILVDIDFDSQHKEELKMIGLWVVSSGKIREDIEKDLRVMFDLASDAQDEINNNYLMESISDGGCDE